MNVDDNRPRSAWRIGPALAAYFKLPMTWTGVAMPLLFQLIFGIVWMTAYDGVYDRTNRVVVGIVNEDSAERDEAVQILESQLPYRVKAFDNLEEAKERLNAREVQMIVHIPAGFAEAAAATYSQAVLHFYINESNPSMMKNMMESAASRITAAINEIAVTRGIHDTLVGLNMAGEDAAGLSNALKSRVAAEIIPVNPVNGFAKQMVPMMTVLASYIGSMLLAVNLEQASLALSARFGRWLRFFARQIINAGTAIIASLLGVALVTWFTGWPNAGVTALWGFQALFIFACMSLAQIPLLLFGLLGSMVNILLLSSQLVSSGAMLPRELLNGFYRSIGSWMPASHGVEGIMNLSLGGPGAADASLSLIIMTAALLALGVGASALRKQKKPSPKHASARA